MIILDWYISQSFYGTSYSQGLKNFKWEKNTVKATIFKFKVLTDWEWFSQGVVATSQSALYQLHPSSHFFWLVADNLSPQKTMLPVRICSSLATENARAGAGVEGSSFLSRVISKREHYRRVQSAHPILVSIFPVLKCKGCFLVCGNDFLRRLLKVRCGFVLCETETRQYYLLDKC